MPLVRSGRLRLRSELLGGVQCGGPVGAQKIDADEKHSASQNIPERLPVIATCRGAGGLQPSAANIAEEVSQAAN